MPSGRKKSVSLRLDHFGHDALGEHLDGTGRSEVAVLHTAVRYYLGDAGSGRTAWCVPRLARSAAWADTLEVELDEDLHAELRLEARRQQVVPDLLAAHAILYYLTDLDSGRAGRLLGDDSSRDGELR